MGKGSSCQGLSFSMFRFQYCILWQDNTYAYKELFFSGSQGRYSRIKWCDTVHHRNLRSSCFCLRVNMYRSEFAIQRTTFPRFSSFAAYVRPLTPLIIRPGRKRDAHISNPSDTESAASQCVQNTHSDLTGKIPMKTKPSAEQGGPFIIFSHSKPHIKFFLAILQTSWMNT